MDYSLKPVYVVSMVNFALEHEGADALEQEYISRYDVRNSKNGERFNETLNFVFLEMGRLALGPDEKDQCKNLLERFIFSMKYMHLFTERPAGFDDPLLVHLYTATELATMTVKRRQFYDTAMTNEIDRMCELSFARKEGEAKQQAKTAKAMLADKVAPEVVAKYTGLTTEEVEALQETN